jgi:hypothetical protein
MGNRNGPAWQVYRSVLMRLGLPELFDRSLKNLPTWIRPSQRLSPKSAGVALNASGAIGIANYTIFGAL